MEFKDQMPQATQLGGEIMSHLDALARLSEGGPGVTRRFATTEHRAASELIQRWMQAAGMRTWMDDAGNTVGRYEGTEPELPALIMGSHQDTVREGGRYDGMLGIVTPIACVKRLYDQGVRLPYAIEIVAFGDEEGVRYQTTLLGSRALAGTFDQSVLDRQDEAGISLRQALLDFNLDPKTIPTIARRKQDVLGFVEVHIEQGPVLEAEELPVGVVTAISGGARLQVSVRGEAGHAGTVPMRRRRDALTGAAECSLAVERHCQADPERLVGTVGKFLVRPGAINVIPGDVVFTIDLRSPDDGLREQAEAAINTEIRAICGRRGLKVTIERTYNAQGCHCDPAIIAQLEQAMVGEGIQPRRLFSGAGHDAMAMVDLCSVGMLFVRCRGGISHHPDESITGGDAGVAAGVLLRFLKAFRLS